MCWQLELLFKILIIRWVLSNMPECLHSNEIFFQNSHAGRGGHFPSDTAFSSGCFQQQSYSKGLNFCHCWESSKKHRKLFQMRSFRMFPTMIALFKCCYSLSRWLFLRASTYAMNIFTLICLKIFNLLYFVHSFNVNLKSLLLSVCLLLGERQHNVVRS